MTYFTVKHKNFIDLWEIPKCYANNLKKIVYYLVVIKKLSGGRTWNFPKKYFPHVGVGHSNTHTHTHTPTHTHTTLINFVAHASNLI